MDVDFEIDINFADLITVLVHTFIIFKY